MAPYTIHTAHTVHTAHTQLLASVCLLSLSALGFASPQVQLDEHPVGQTVLLANYQLEYLHALDHPEATVDQLRDAVASVTAESGHSLVEWLLNNPAHPANNGDHKPIGKASVFVALGAGYRTADLLQEMDSYIKRVGSSPEDTYFLADIFVVRQHVHGNMFKCNMDDLEMLSESIASIDSAATTFVCNPWQHTCRVRVV
jgi:hypothetical protein